MTWKAVIVASAALVAAHPAFAGRVFPPQSESDAITVPPTVGRDRVRELRLGAHLVRQSFPRACLEAIPLPMLSPPSSGASTLASSRSECRSGPSLA